MQKQLVILSFLCVFFCYIKRCVAKGKYVLKLFYLVVFNLNKKKLLTITTRVVVILQDFLKEIMVVTSQGHNSLGLHSN